MELFQQLFDFQKQNFKTFIKKIYLTVEYSFNMRK